MSKYYEWATHEHQREMLRNAEIDRLLRAPSSARAGLLAQVRQWLDEVPCRFAGFRYRLRALWGGAPAHSPCA